MSARAPIDWPAALFWIQATSGRLTEDDRLERARTLVDEAFAEPLSIEALARCACLSPEHFIRAFKRAYGLTPHQYVTRQRIIAARALLEATDLPVTEVCLEVGFSSLGSFSTMFRKQTGHSPARYRRRIVQNLGLVDLPYIPTCFAMRFSTATKSTFEKSGPVRERYAPHP